MLEAEDTKTTKIQPLIQRVHKKPTNIASSKLLLSSEFHVLVGGNTQSPKPETFESSLTHFLSQLAFNSFPSLFYFTSKNSLILYPPLQSCCHGLVLHLVIILLDYCNSFLRGFSAFKPSPLLPDQLPFFTTRVAV